MPITAYIGIGSNLGEKESNCRKAIELLSRAGRVVRVSSFYCTEPVGYRDQESFINAVAEVETEMSPIELLAVCHMIENDLGRSRLFRWGPRSIDLDILLYGDAVVNESNLSIPHPFLSVRRFVLAPLCEISPEITHPISKKTISHLLHELRDPHKVVKCA